MIGRPYLYGLAAAGEEGVDWVIEHLRAGMKRDMALCGAASVSELTPDLIYRARNRQIIPIPRVDTHCDPRGSLRFRLDTLTIMM